VERLEDRSVPAVFTVTNTDDTGAGSFRQAIIDANATPGADTIQFALPDTLKSPGGWWTIQPLSALPMLTDSDTIDGWSQPGAGPGLAPRVMVDGTNAGPAYGGIYLGSNCTVRGLAVGNFVVRPPGTATAGVTLQFTNNIVEGCYLGLDPTGMTAASNVFGVADYGVGDVIGGSGPGEGNVTSGNISANILSNGYGVTIQGNFVGTNAAGTAAVNGTSDGLRVGFVPSDAYTSVIADNLISGNGGSGIQLSQVHHVRILGNLIGTDVTGMHALGNGGPGIFVAGGVTDAVIGGTDPSSRNVISGNGDFGFRIQSDSVVVQGNYIGTDVTGAPTVGNSAGGMGVGGDGCLIGGAEPGAGNLIAGNGAGSEGGGVVLAGSNNLVEGNVIHDNFGAGVFIGINAQAVGNTASQNSIYDTHSTRTRAGLGIDILANSSDPGGVTLNDSMGHDGPNHFQNFPVLTTAQYGSVTGTLNSVPNTTFRIEFFANHEADPSGYGEGERYLGFVNVTPTRPGTRASPPRCPPCCPGRRSSRPRPRTGPPATPRSSRRTSPPRLPRRRLASPASSGRISITTARWTSARRTSPA
jgi:titin